ncbi:MAG: lytic transglycosylase domain-containing protein [Rhodospirillaceae bacterium]|nr:lytic transglycosylase domain-containing protein [Rhodospirillaceae bacterium]
MAVAAAILGAGALAGCGGSSPPINSGYQVSAEDIDDYIAEASDRFNLPEPWIREIMRVESGGQQYLNGRPITSSAGAMGLMQVMPATYEELRRRHDLGSDPYDPRNNILAGTAYLREMYDLFGSPGFLAAYNAGPGRYAQFVAEGRPLPMETQRYVDLIYPRIAGHVPDGEVYARTEVPSATHRPIRLTRAD